MRVGCVVNEWSNAELGTLSYSYKRGCVQRCAAMAADSTSDSWYSGGASSFFGVDLNGDGEDDGMLRVAVITLREYLDSLTEDERTRTTGLLVVSFIGLLACVAARLFKRCCCPHADKLLL